MKPGAGNLKGGEFERHISRILTEWITGKPKPEVFWRTASSGGKATQDYKKGIKSRMQGDIIGFGEGEWFTNIFFIECKFRENFDIGKILTGKGQILKWWEKAVEEANRVEKIPLLIMKKNRSPIYLFWDDFLFREFSFYQMFGEFDFDYLRIGQYNSYPKLLCLLKDFLKFVDQESLRGGLIVSDFQSRNKKL